MRIVHDSEKSLPSSPMERASKKVADEIWLRMLNVSMILPQVHLRKPCYDFCFL